MNTNVNLKQKRSRRPIIILTLLIVGIIIGLITMGVIKFKNHYNNPSLIGEWISEETGKTVEFTEAGILEVDDVTTGTYIIESPGLIIYEVEGYTFEMDYAIDQRGLVWGFLGEEEKFERKGI